LEDEKIIDLFWKRDELAISNVAKKYGNYLRSISYNILYNSQDSDECINDTYLKTWNAIPPKRPQKLKIWLGKITRNLSLDKYRKNRAQKRGGGEIDFIFSELEQCIPDKNKVENEIEDKEMADSISLFLNNCSLENRVIFMRRYYFGDSIANISKKYNISESKVKSSLFRTRNKLKIYLEKEGVLI